MQKFTFNCSFNYSFYNYIRLVREYHFFLIIIYLFYALAYTINLGSNGILKCMRYRLNIDTIGLQEICKLHCLTLVINYLPSVYLDAWNTCYNIDILCKCAMK